MTDIKKIIQEAGAALFASPIPYAGFHCPSCGQLAGPPFLVHHNMGTVSYNCDCEFYEYGLWINEYDNLIAPEPEAEDTPKLPAKGHFSRTFGGTADRLDKRFGKRK